MGVQYFVMPPIEGKPWLGKTAVGMITLDYVKPHVPLFGAVGPSDSYWIVPNTIDE